jgi:thiosulfate dehydrogenase [quinone] large subunit
MKVMAAVPSYSHMSFPKLAAETGLQNSMLVLFRLLLGWTFLYAGTNQVLNANWTAGRFLAHAKIFPEMFAWFGSPAVVPYVDFLVQWGHLLIGVSLILGICVRLSSGFGAMMMILYYLPRLDFPMVGAHNFIVEYHLVYALILIYLGVMRAGRVGGLENWVAGLPVIPPVLAKYPGLRTWLG